MTRCRRANAVLWIIVTLLMTCPAPEAYSADADKKAENVILRVNGEPIGQETLDKEMARYEGQAAQSDQPPDPAKKEALRKKVLDGMVDRILLLQESQKLGISVTDAEVDEEMSKFKARFPKPEQFEAILARMKVTEADVRTEYRRRIAIRAVVEREVTPKATVAEADIKAFYDQNPSLFKVPEQVRASHILVKVDEQATDQDKAKAREKILALKKKVENGEDFAAVAKDNSDCPSAAQGGDLDFFQRGQMVASFEESAFALKPGEMSDVVETQFGYHLIKVTDRKEPGDMPFEEMKPTIEEHLKQQKIADMLTAYKAELRSKAKIDEVSSK